MDKLFTELKAPFPHDQISWRVGATNKDKTKAIPLAYLDARDVMERLDMVVGPANWQALYPHANGKTSCKIGILTGTEWVWKENGCGDSDIEAAKGAFSDAFKRSAVLWGIGRYLYDVPNIWVEIDEWKKIRNPKDKRLIEALKSAEKGIRLPPEPEEIILPVSGDEFLLMQGEIKDCENIEQLVAAWQKINLAAPRMSNDQVKTLTKAKDNKKITLTQSPIG